MKAFFIVATRNGTELPTSEVGRLVREFRSALSFYEHVAQEETFIGEGFLVYAATNEPGAEFRYRFGIRTAFVSGDVLRLPDLAPSKTLGRKLAATPGRFCIGVAERERFAVATAPLRVDPIFEVETEDYLIFGTQASALAVVAGGGIQYDVEALYSFISTGFFGTDQAAFKGVRALPPLTTVLWQRGRQQRFSIAYRELRRPLRRHVRRCTSAFVRALAECNVDERPISLGLSGGKDSRLILAGLLNAGIPVSCSTTSRGADNASDVYVAKQIAAMVDVPHKVGVPMHRRSETTAVVDLLQQAASTLRATDGANYVHDRVSLRTKFMSGLAVAGLGGEVMRGGYAEHRPLDITMDRVRQIAFKQFSGFPFVFRPEATERYRTELASWLSRQEAAPIDVLDFLYAYFRCGRWIAGTSRGAVMSGAKLYPFLDNRLSLAMLETPVRARLEHRMIRSIIRRLNPALAEFPLAGEHWGDSSPAERAKFESLYPEAYADRPAGPRMDWRNSPPEPIMAHIREYCTERLDLLTAIVDPDAARSFLYGEKAAAVSYKKVLFGLYSACVLTSGDWLTDATTQIKYEIGNGSQIA